MDEANEMRVLKQSMGTELLMIYHQSLAFWLLQYLLVDRVVLPLLRVACFAVVFLGRILDRPVVLSSRLENEQLRSYTTMAER